MAVGLVVVSCKIREAELPNEIDISEVQQMDHRPSETVGFAENSRSKPTGVLEISMIPILGELAEIVGSFEQRIGVVLGGRVPVGEIAETS